MQLKIYCDDRTDSALFFYPEFFTLLSAQGHSLYLNINNPKNNYGYYFRKFKNIHPVEAQKNLREFDIALVFHQNKGIEDFLADHIPVLYVRVVGECSHKILIEVHAGKDITKFQVSAVGKLMPFYFPDSGDLYDLIERTCRKPDLDSLHFLISAGPTVEDIDPVRFLSNRSSGKMGIALARAAFVRGAEVELIHGPVKTRIPEYLITTSCYCATDMAEAVLNRFTSADVFVSCAAVADYTPLKRAKQKIKKQPGEFTLKLKRTTDILKTVAKDKRPGQSVIGFSVETQNELTNSKDKLIKKNLDMIVINNPKIKGAEFAAETNLVTLISKEQRPISLPVMPKIQVAHKIFDYFLEDL